MPACVEPRAQPRHAFLMPLALGRADLQMADAGQRAGGDGRRQRRGEDEARGEAADEIADRRRGGDIAADHAERLGERAFDHGQAMAQPFALGDAAAARAVEADARAPRRDRSWRRARRRRRRAPRSARCRHPSNRPIRTRPASARRGSRSLSLRSRSRGSLCAKMRFSARLWRMPSIIEAWLQLVRQDRRSPASATPACRASPSSRRSPR